MIANKPIIIDTELDEWLLSKRMGRESRNQVLRRLLGLKRLAVRSRGRPKKQLAKK